MNSSSLLKTIHSHFEDGIPNINVDSTTELQLDDTVDSEFLENLWRHAYLRNENQTMTVTQLHPTAPSALKEIISNLPTEDTFLFTTALQILLPFLTRLTEENPSTSCHSGLLFAFTLDHDGNILKSDLKLTGPIDLSPITSELQNGTRSFDVFYHFLNSLNELEKNVFNIKSSPSEDYKLLKSNIFKLNELDYLKDLVVDDELLASDWRLSFEHFGFTKSEIAEVYSVLGSILLLGNADENDDDLVDGATLLSLGPEIFELYTPTQVLETAYLKLVNFIINKLNEKLSLIETSKIEQLHKLENDSKNPDLPIAAVVNIIELPNEQQYRILRSVFDDTIGINNEILADGFNSGFETNELISGKITQMEYSDNEKTQERLDYFKKNIISNDVVYNAGPIDVNANKGIFKSDLSIDDLFNTTLELSEMFIETRVWSILNMAPSSKSCLVNQFKNQVWSTQHVSKQIRHIKLLDWINKRTMLPYCVDFDYDEFINNYLLNGVNVLPEKDSLTDWCKLQGWGIEQVFCGDERVWVTENVWNILESRAHTYHDPSVIAIPQGQTVIENPFDPQQMHLHDQLFGSSSPMKTVDDNDNNNEDQYNQLLAEDYLEDKLPTSDPSIKAKDIKTKTLSRERKLWITFVWGLTWWIPSPILKYVGGMRRPDVRMAWREKVVICFFIFLLNASIIFYMIFLMRFICPDFDKVWNTKEVGYHQGVKDYYGSINGKVYDFTKFYKTQHSDTPTKTSSLIMMPFAGQELSVYFPKPLTYFCPDLVKDHTVWFQINETRYPDYDSSAVHYSGDATVIYNTSATYKYTWYDDVLEPALKTYYKGDLVMSRNYVEKMANEDNYNWAIVNNSIYDLSPYIFTLDTMDGWDQYKFLSTDITNLFRSDAGTDITSSLGKLVDENDGNLKSWQCIQNIGYAGKVDFRHSARCQASNYILLGMAIALSSVTVIKFLTALQFNQHKIPSPQSKYVICQIPAYTEDETALRLAIDSITDLKYDNQRKLLFLICDGVVTGAGNSKSTAQTVLDIFGVDEKYDPPALPFRSVGEGSAKLNYGKVYSGLYEFEGSVCPYIVVVKVGKASEVSKPGNRGKRDSQLIIFRYLNCVHYQKPMNPLELEIFHHMNNIIGVDPELYEYLFVIDADTKAEPQSLSFLVSSCSADRRIAGICGETKLMNEEKSLFTMLQIYEYYISHHMAKAFESLFGSVTCLPGCFTLYRLRFSDNGRPIIISDEVINDYAVDDVDTLHTKNLFSLGEDRYLTTLLAKHFPHARLTFNPDAQAKTMAPEQFEILLSQRRRWINSTVHNLIELLKLNNMCGMCCFGMRFIVFVDLAGTLMLPSVFIYLVYLVYVIASRSSELPLISIIMIAGVYGLQMILYILKREWENIGWMVVYFLGYPVHSFILPIYSFWFQDDFTWGNTRVIIEEKNGKQVIAVNEDNFDERMIPLETWTEYAMRNGLPGAARSMVYHHEKRDLTHPTNRFQEYNSQLIEQRYSQMFNDIHTEYYGKDNATINTEHPQYYPMKDFSRAQSLVYNSAASGSVNFQAHVREQSTTPDPRISGYFGSPVSQGLPQSSLNNLEIWAPKPQSLNTPVLTATDNVYESSNRPSSQPRVGTPTRTAVSALKKNEIYRHHQRLSSIDESIANYSNIPIKDSEHNIPGHSRRNSTPIKTRSYGVSANKSSALVKRLSYSNSKSPEPAVNRSISQNSINLNGPGSRNTLNRIRSNSRDNLILDRSSSQNSINLNISGSQNSLNLNRSGSQNSLILDNINRNRSASQDNLNRNRSASQGILNHTASTVNRRETLNTMTGKGMTRSKSWDNLI